jgi:glycosyltransferase involved in cell wall biosynthesis
VHDGWWISDHQFLLDPALQPSVYNHADPLSQLEQGGAASFARMTALFGHLAAARAVLAVSEPFAALHRACGLRNVLAVPNGVPAFARARRAPAPDGRVRLGFLGGIAPHKGYHVLKAALLSRPYANLALTVVDHALYPGGEAREVWGGVPVRFVARTPQAQIGRLYAETDVLLAPSVWPESFGLVAREALQAGCWIVASDQGAMAADLTPRHGFVADVRGIDGLRDILCRIDGEPDRYRAPPPPCGGMRTAREQAEQLAALYLETAAVTRPPPRAGAKRPRAARLVEAA